MKSTEEQIYCSLIIPAYNEETVIGTVVTSSIKVLESLDTAYELLVIDDGSRDRTAQVAEATGAKVIRHPYNIGNGAAVKTGIRAANGEVVVLMDGDGQHTPEDIQRLLEKMQDYHMVVGARTAQSETAWYRDWANKVYNLFATYVCGRKIDDLTSGFRAIKTDVAKGFVYLLPNTFSYPSTITLAVVRAGYSLTYIPIQTNKRIGRSKIRLLPDGLRFLSIILRITVFFAPLKVFLPMSFAIFMFGIAWWIYNYFVNQTFPPAAVLSLLISIVIFTIGLVSEQISYLRYQQDPGITHK
ncbi:MAG: glycosyltransferase family 2 protein [Chloroflexi bacterium]|nr:MAG: glycosyltransferase family 2 protein [Chloroflexota bacterium]MBL1193152.1 glycosyltransferase family 2 protein [Chloroflexota bacterium]NOH10445.1 glycosyltransferase family 2 protein [Chloroflexota bacterium]